MIAKLVDKVRRHGLRHSFFTGLMKMKLLPKQNWGEIQPVFIVSTGRTGTKYLAELLKQTPGVFAYHEPHPDFLKLGLDYACGKVTMKNAARQIEQGRRALCVAARGSKANIYVESNNRLFSLLQPLRQVFPDAKIIHVVRKGEDYVRSGMGRPWYREGDSAYRLRADWFPDDPFCNLWSQMSRFEKITWRWQKKDGLIHADIQKLDNAIKITFDELFKMEGRPGLHRLAEFAGISKEQLEAGLKAMGDNVPNQTPESNRAQSVSDWSPEMFEQFEKVAGPYYQKHFPEGFQRPSTS